MSFQEYFSPGICISWEVGHLKSRILSVGCISIKGLTHRTNQMIPGALFKNLTKYYFSVGDLLNAP